MENLSMETTVYGTSLYRSAFYGCAQITEWAMYGTSLYGTSLYGSALKKNLKTKFNEQNIHNTKGQIDKGEDI